MQLELTERLGIDLPVFAFSHCRDVVAAVSAAGGMGVLGASAFTAEEIAIELDWLDENCGGAPYAVDFAFPPRDLTQQPRQPEGLPAEHRRFVDDLLSRYDVPALPDGAEEGRATYRGVDWGAYGQALEIVFEHPKVRLLASALGAPPDWVVQRAHDADMLVGALCGSPVHAVRNKAAGVDLLICQGTEAGGHTGEISTMVLVPQVVDAVYPTPVVAAGGIASGRQMAAAMALGASAVWTGSMWLATEESDLADEMQRKLLDATSAQTVRSRSLTGKPCRVVKAAWTDEWDADDAPSPLPMPLQGMLVEDAVQRIERAARREGAAALDLLTCPAGQVIGQMNRVHRSSQLLLDMVTEYVDTIHSLGARAGL